MKSYKETKKLRELRLRVGKAESSFVYFTFEANEGVAFYSTLDDSLDENHRDLLVQTTPEYYDQLKQEIEHLQKRMPLKVLTDELIDDISR